MADRTAFDPVLRRRVLLGLRGLSFLIGAAVLASMVIQIRSGELHADFSWSNEHGPRIQQRIWLTGPVGIGCWALANGSVALGFLVAALRPPGFRNPRLTIGLISGMVLGVGGLQLLRWLRAGS